MFAIRIAPTQSGHGSAGAKGGSARGSNDSAESARIAFTSACARRVRPIWPGAGSSQIRLRPCATTTPWTSAIAAPTGTVPAAYAAQACSSATRQGEPGVGTVTYSGAVYITAFDIRPGWRGYQGWASGRRSMMPDL